MPLLGLGVVFMGYSLMYYGITQVRGGNWGLLDLVIPGKFDPTIPSDDPGTTTKPGAYGSTAGTATAGAEGAATIAAGGASLAKNPAAQDPAASFSSIVSGVNSTAGG